MPSPEERAELDQMATALAYESILFSGLYKSLSNEAWDLLAAQLGRAARQAVEQGIDAEYVRLETESEQKQ